MKELAVISGSLPSRELGKVVLRPTVKTREVSTLHLHPVSGKTSNRHVWRLLFI